MEEIPAARKTNHKRWLAGAVLLFIPIPLLLAVRPGESPRSPHPAPLPAAFGAAPPLPGAGPVTCGQCDGDGRIDKYDRFRRVPTTSAAAGDCPYCGPGRTVGSPASRLH